MPSEFDILANEFCSDAMSEHFGERDELGDFQKVIYKTPQGDEFELKGVIVHNLRTSDEVGDEHGTHLRDEIEDILELTIPRAQGDKPFSPQTESRFTVPEYGETPFTLLEVVSLSATWANVRVTRTAVTRIQRGQHERR